ncbi:MAG: hypothetical protein LUC47_06455 [Clostridiales bacterium]|nr:hypothetical protein [Clostridiales bacterium]
MLKLRFALLLTAFSLALTLSCAALSSPWPQAVETAAETALAAASADDEPNGEAVPLYELRSVDGEICVFRSGDLLTHTGVLTASLPREDRALLEAGIGAKSDQELASLLEDLCS